MKEREEETLKPLPSRLKFPHENEKKNDHYSTKKKKGEYFFCLRKKESKLINREQEQEPPVGWPTKRKTLVIRDSLLEQREEG